MTNFCKDSIRNYFASCRLSLHASFDMEKYLASYTLCKAASSKHKCLKQHFQPHLVRLLFAACPTLTTVLTPHAASQNYLLRAAEAKYHFSAGQVIFPSCQVREAASLLFDEGQFPTQLSLLTHSCCPAPMPSSDLPAQPPPTPLVPISNATRMDCPAIQNHCQNCPLQKFMIGLPSYWS